MKARGNLSKFLKGLVSLVMAVANCVIPGLKKSAPDVEPHRAIQWILGLVASGLGVFYFLPAWIVQAYNKEPTGFVLVLIGLTLLGGLYASYALFSTGTSVTQDGDATSRANETPSTPSRAAKDVAKESDGQRTLLKFAIMAVVAGLLPAVYQEFTNKEAKEQAYRDEVLAIFESISTLRGAIVRFATECSPSACIGEETWKDRLSNTQCSDSFKEITSQWIKATWINRRVSAHAFKQRCHGSAKTTNKHLEPACAILSKSGALNGNGIPGEQGGFDRVSVIYRAFINAYMSGRAGQAAAPQALGNATRDFFNYSRRLACALVVVTDGSEHTPELPQSCLHFMRNPRAVEVPDEKPQLQWVAWWPLWDAGTPLEDADMLPEDAGTP